MNNNITTSNITIDNKNRAIIITKSFEKVASRYNSNEYIELKNVRNDFPNFKVAIRKNSKSSKIAFRGLTYEYMEMYIKKHDDEKASIMNEYMIMRGIGEEASEALADSLSYAEIKEWFLDKFPEIEAFHKKREELMKKVEERKNKAKAS